MAPEEKRQVVLENVRRFEEARGGKANDEIDPEETRRVAAAALRPEGLAFVLRGMDPDGTAKTLIREQRELEPRAFGTVAECSESGELLWSP